MSGQSSPHDAVFRRIIGEPTNAASQLQAVLPAGLTSRLNLNRLTRVQGSFVDAELRWRHSDLLFTAPLERQEAFIYILVEHQSSPDPLMPFGFCATWCGFGTTTWPSIPARLACP